MARLFILTGPSGSGKTSAQYVFEERGFFVIDNILPSGVKPILEDLFIKEKKYNNCLLVATPNYAKEIYDIAYKVLNKLNIQIDLIVLDCNYQTLYKRYKLTRHVHPLTMLDNITLEEALKLDKENMKSLDDITSYYFDTSAYDVGQLRKILFNLIDMRKENDLVNINFISFGHKFGIPLDVDLILDTRVLPNPFWDKNLCKYNGLDVQIVDYFKKYPICDEVFRKMVEYLDYYIDLVQKDGKGNFTIGICCSGGKHRSVYIANRLTNHYKNKYNVMCFHRDINKE